MLNSLYKFLVLHDHVSIPGVGTFSVQRTSASYDGSAFKPPRQEIQFQPGTALADKKFYDFLAADHQFSGLDAVRKFQDFAYQLKKDIHSKNFVELAGLGILKNNNVGEIIFESSEVNSYFPKLSPTEVQHQHSSVADNTFTQEIIVDAEEEVDEDDVVKKDRWWIWATVLAILALAAIGYFYMTEM
jgi:nucleoid DNA-binding protein